MKTLCRIMLILSLLGADYVNAQEADEGKLFMEPVGSGAAGYFFIKGKPGEKHTITLKITNTSNEFKGSGMLFISDAITGKGGGMATMTPEMAERKRTAKWFPFSEKKIELQPGQVRMEKITFTIPPNTPPGDHIANAAMYKFVPSKESTNEQQNDEAKIIVNNAYSQSYAVWVKIEGEEQHQLDVTKLNTTWNGADLFLDINFSNKGNVLEKSSGTVKIYKGNELVMEHNGEMGSIYPYNDALYSFPANEEARQPGKYKVVVNWTYGGKTINKELSYENTKKETKTAEDVVVKDNGEKDKPEGLFITKEDLIKYGLITAAVIAVLIVGIISYMKKVKK